MILRPVALDESALGRPLPWDVFDRHGVLVLARDAMVGDSVQLARLAGRSLYRDVEKELAAVGRSGGSPVTRLAAAREALAGLLAGHPDDWPLAVRLVAADVSDAVHADPDASFGWARLERKGSDRLRHAMFSAVVCEMVAAETVMPDESRRAVVAAALTMNIALPDSADALGGQTSFLAEAEREAVRRHPAAAAGILADRGVTDPAWLTAVAHHHEALDGSGFPDGLADTAIPREARLLRLADVYCLRLMNRSYRPESKARLAVRELFSCERRRLDPGLAAALIRRVGPWAPGTLVRLASRETAVVLRHAGGSRLPEWVRVIVDARGHFVHEPRTRNTTSSRFAIRYFSHLDESLPDIDCERVWGYR